MQLIEVNNFEDCPPLAQDCGLASSFGAATATEPDARWLVVHGATCQSRCAVWWHQVPQMKGHCVGLIGQYAASDEDSAQLLLVHACQRLRAAGCSLAVGPMDGNTWGNYRFVTESGDHPGFWMEPSNPRRWPLQFQECGFQPVASYFSALNSRLKTVDSRLDQVRRRLDALGVWVRPVAAESFDDDLRRIYEVVRLAFHDNLLYSDLDPSTYLNQFRQWRELVPLELSWIAEHAGQVIGFVFAVPDLKERERGQAIRTVVIKTLAVLPNRAYAGLGQLLLANAQHRALRSGFSQAIHALVRDVGSLRRISARYARPIRRYTLFAKALTS